MTARGACRSLLVLLLALLLLAAAAEASLPSVFLEVHHQTSPRLLLVPLEAGKVWLVELVVGLTEVNINRDFNRNGMQTHPLLELLVDCVQRILDCDSLEVPCCYLESEGEMEVNLLDRRCCEHLLEVFLVIYRHRGRVDLPASDRVLVGCVARFVG